MLQRKISLVLALTMLVALAVPAMAQDTAKQPSAAQAAQQQKMTDCNAQAKTKGLTGDDRKKFMSQCLSAAGVPQSQQEKMKSCNKEATAKNLKGDDRKAFMSTCLSGSTK
jgi:psiF repeat